VLVRVHYKEMKQKSIHGPKFICYSNVGAKTAHCNNKQVRFHNAETLCEEEKLKYLEFRRKQYNIHFLSNIFQSGVINVTLCTLLMKTSKFHSFIIKTVSLTTFLVIF
jgi:hypothetical protein